eukprot:scaffold112219_cov27-Tisochrysis_lutea.AAC.1
MRGSQQDARIAYTGVGILGVHVGSGVGGSSSGARHPVQLDLGHDLIRLLAQLGGDRLASRHRVAQLALPLCRSGLLGLGGALEHVLTALARLPPQHPSGRARPARPERREQGIERRGWRERGGGVAGRLGSSLTRGKGHSVVDETQLHWARRRADGVGGGRVGRGGRCLLVGLWTSFPTRFATNRGSSRVPTGRRGGRK